LQPCGFSFAACYNLVSPERFTSRLICDFPPRADPRFRESAQPEVYFIESFK
jgi:hypothetical protein